MIFERPTQALFFRGRERVYEVDNCMVSPAAYGDFPLAAVAGVCASLFEFADADYAVLW